MTSSSLYEGDSGSGYFMFFFDMLDNQMNNFRYISQTALIQCLNEIWSQSCSVLQNYGQKVVSLAEHYDLTVLTN